MKTPPRGVPQEDMAYSGNLHGGLVNLVVCQPMENMKGKKILVLKLVHWSSACAVIAAAAAVAAQGTKMFCTKVLIL